MKNNKVFSVFNKKNTLICAYVVAILCAFLVAVSLCPIKSYATAKSGRWATNSITSTVDIENEEKALNTEADSNPILDFFSEAIVAIADWFNNALRTGSITGVDASITGIIMGTVTNDDGNSVFVFSLADNNIYGVIGATIYVALRSLAMMFIFLMTLWAIVKRLFTSKPGQGISDLKQALYDAILFMAFLYYCPYLVDYICVARDYFMSLNVRTASGLLSDLGGGEYSNISSFVDIYRQNYETTKTIGNAVVYLLVSIMPVHFLISYIQIAIQQTVLFGMFPVFCVSGMSDKKSLSGWLSVTVSNAFIPALDALLITFALMIKAQIDTMLESWGGTLLSVIMILVMLRAVVPARDRILSLLSGAVGLPMGGGGRFSALAALGGAAVAGVGKAVGSALGKKSDKDGEPQGGNSDVKSEADKGMSSKDNMKDPPQTKDDDGGSKGDAPDDKTGAGGGEGGGNQDIPEAVPGSGGESGDDEAAGSGSDIGTQGAGDGVGGGDIGVGEDSSGEGSIPAAGSAILDQDAASEMGEIGQLAEERADSMYGKDGKRSTDSDNRDAYLDEVNKRATNLGEMDTINRRNDQIAIDNADSKLQISDAQAKMSANTREIEKKEKELEGLTDGDKKSKLQGEIDGLKAENEKHQGTIDKHTHDMASRDKEKAENDRELKKKTAVEQNYANKQANRGFDGTSYKSASEFKSALTKQNNLVKGANYKNFKNNENLQGVLSDKEVKRLSASAKRHEVLKGATVGLAAGTAKVAAGAALGAVAAGAAYVATAGLDEAQASQIINNSAQLGYNTGKVVGHGANKVVAAGGNVALKGIGTVRKSAGDKLDKDGLGAVKGGGDDKRKAGEKKGNSNNTQVKKGNNNNNDNASKRIDNRGAGQAKKELQTNNQNNNTNARRRMDNRNAEQAKKEQQGKSNPNNDQFVNNYKKMQEESSKRNAERASRIIKGK